ncbi:Uncharacterised protein [Yersinia frederiksenii]|nr:Uncharacterised protein [Yersinia frederiksenii]CNH19504.1 Uncharacterised protein [Yersinia frederiksenii]CNH80779.1 Uncharacterised protein [Yersinia kristensenii]CQH59281.1 Uncharacterised protein [Yersinia enterocolitica]CQJ40504.1 Uncharacterised protein [Yersinia enterocolitica]
MDSTTKAPCRTAFLHLPTSLAATLPPEVRHVR